MLYGVEADFTREGGAIPETITLQKATEGLAIVSMEACNHGAYFQNERIKNINPSFMESLKVDRYIQSITKTDRGLENENTGPGGSGG